MAKKRSAPKPDLAHIVAALRPLAVPCADLVLDPANARTHPGDNLDAIAGSLAVYGQRKPLVVRRDTATVIAGNGTLLAARTLGWTHVAAVFVEDDAATAAGFAIADNRTSDLSAFDREALGLLMRDLNTGDDERLDRMMADLATAQGIAPAGSADVPDAETVESDEDEDALDLLFKAPFPWFGGKARVARLVWERFGDVQSYVEPFFGSGAVLLNRPQPFSGTETVNDFDALVCNFWRAVAADPDVVASHADWPVNENDLHARHAWLVGQKETLQARLEGDSDHCDAKIAGWWVWGMACWIGSGFCSGNGPWQVVEQEDGSRQLVHLSNAGQGVNRKRVHLGDAGRGVNRQLVHLGDAGQGVNRQLVHLGDAGRGVTEESGASTASASTSATPAGAGRGECGLLAWIQALSERLRRVRVCCGDWTRVCGGDSGNALKHFFASGQTCGVFLDPPYADTADRDPTLYRVDSASVAHAVRAWAVAHGDDPRLRIALCGYEGEHEMPSSWRVVAWKAPGGYASCGDADSRGNVNSRRERIWFSPHCLVPRTAETAHTQDGA